MKRGCPDHPKTIAFARVLNLPRYSAVGLLEMLWHWTAKYAPRGDVGRFSDGQIAEAVSWTDEPTKLVRAYIDTRWLDEHKTHRLVVHDWSQHADDATKKYLARHGLKFVDSVRTKSRQSRDSGGTGGEPSPDSGTPAVAVVSAVAKPLPLPEPQTDNGALSISPSQASVTDYELEPCSSNKVSVEPVPMSESERTSYARIVWKAFRDRAGHPETHQMATAEWDLLRRWMDKSVPLRVVLHAIAETKGPRDQLRLLTYFGPSVNEEHERVSLALSGTR